MMDHHTVFPLTNQTHGIPHGQQRFHLSPQKTEQDPKANGSAAGDLHKGHPQLRAGLAIHTGLSGTADVFPCLQGG